MDPEDPNFERMQWFIDGLVSEVWEVRTKLNGLIEFRYQRRKSSVYAGADAETKRRLIDNSKRIQKEIGEHLDRIELNLQPLYALGDEYALRFKEVIEQWFAFVKESNAPATQPDDVLAFQIDCDKFAAKVAGTGFAIWQFRLTVDGPCEEWLAEY